MNNDQLSIGKIFKWIIIYLLIFCIVFGLISVVFYYIDKVNQSDSDIEKTQE